MYVQAMQGTNSFLSEYDTFLTLFFNFRFILIDKFIDLIDRRV